ncbi:MAG TPA: glycosyltransferase [Candidatus Synoicihabitans sp.]|nr:glycosyltransferase [Candidatus Synoicihabitans sp.]
MQDHLRSGGTERQAVLLARGFTRAGHDCTLLTFRPGGALAADLSGVKHYTLQARDWGLDWFAPGLLRHLRRAQPDLVLCLGRMANCYGASLQRALPRAVVIATLRTGKRLPWLFRRSLRVVRHVVANSHEAKLAISTELHLDPTRVTVIHNSLVFPPTGPSARNEALRAAHGAGPDTIVLLCVAMFRPEKNQRALIEIVRGLPESIDWRLWLAGDGPARIACEALATQAGLDARVRFCGWMADPTALYHAADLAVLTSTRESLSNFLIEAQAHGLPVVASVARGVAEAFAPNESGYLVAAGDTEGFRQRLVTLATDHAHRRQMGARARNYAREHFSPERQLQAYLDLFEALRSPAAS